MIHQLTDKPKEILAVEVPDTATEIEIRNYGVGRESFEYCYSVEGCAAYDVTDLHPGTWRYICTSKDVTRWQASEIVEVEELYINGNSQGLLYCNYFIPHDVCEWYKDPFNSLNSLIASKGLDNSKQYALIEKM